MSIFSKFVCLISGSHEKVDSLQLIIRNSAQPVLSGFILRLNSRSGKLRAALYRRFAPGLVPAFHFPFYALHIYDLKISFFLLDNLFYDLVQSLRIHGLGPVCLGQTNAVTIKY